MVGPSDHPDADVDYLFLQLGVDEATVSDQQNCGNILAGVGPFAVERGLVPAGHAETSVRIRMVNSDSIAVATFPTPDGRVEYRGDVAIAGVPGTAAPVVLAFTDTEGSATGSLLPTGNVRDAIDGIEVTCVDNGMPVVVAMAESFGLTGDETHERAGGRHGPARTGRRLPPQGRAADGPRRRVRVVRAEDGAARRRPATAARSAPARSSRCSRTPRSACWPR